MTIKNKRNLGNTGLKISPLGFGAMELKHEEVGIKEAANLLNYALDNGVNYIDTSPCYGDSESLIGKTISSRRDEYILATKCGHKIGANGKVIGGQEWTKDNILRSVDESLKKIKTDYVDVLQLNNLNPKKDLKEGRNDEIIKALQKIKKEGKALNIGISFRNGQKNDELYPAGYGYKGLKEVINWEVFDVVQIVYGTLTRKNENIIQRASENNIGIVVRGVIKRYYDNYKDLIRKAELEEYCESDEEINSLLIRFVLTTPGISTMIIGTKNIDHLKENIKAIKRGKLPKKRYKKVKNRLKKVGIKPDK